MTARQTTGIWIVFVILLVWYVAFEREAPEIVEPATEREKIVDVFPDEVSALSVTRGGKSVRAELIENRWKVVEPKDVTVPADLVSAILSTIAEKQEAEVIAESPDGSDLATYGLDEPRVVITLERTSGPAVTLDVGERNPTRTAVYARSSQSTRVLLAGLNVDYYSEILFEAAFPDQPMPEEAPEEEGPEEPPREPESDDPVRT